MDHGYVPGSGAGSGPGDKYTKKAKKPRGAVCEKPTGRVEDDFGVGEPRRVNMSDASTEPGYSHKKARQGASKSDLKMGYS